jgi:integrase
MDTMATFPTEPTLQPHHDGKSWTTYWRDDVGKMRVKRLGKHTVVNAREAKARFRQWLDSEWKVKDSIRNPGGAVAKFTCTRLAALYLRFAHKTFRKEGKPTTHVTGVLYAVRALRDFCGEELAENITAPRIAALRDWMIRDGDGKARSTTTVNGRLLIVKEAFVWALERGLVPAAVALAIKEVKRLTPGRCDAAAPKRVLPIDRSVVDTTLAHCSRVVAAMIQVNLYTGARPGEIVIMRPCDLEMAAADCWIFTPYRHKTQHKGRERRIALGPHAIAAVRPFLEEQKNTRGYLFSPAVARAEQDEARRQQYAQDRGEVVEPRAEAVEKARMRWPGAVYSEETYRRAIHYACRKAGIAPWNPNQLRHSHATEIRRVFGLAGLLDGGLDAAKETLGHSDSETSEIYARESLERAMAIARRVG